MVVGGIPMNLQDARIDAGLTVAALSREARVDRKTIERAEAGERITRVKAVAIVKALSRITGKSYSVASLGIVA
jgi:predicted transcriptional regulator